MFNGAPFYTPLNTASLVGNAIKGFSWAKLFAGTQKTLTFINQAVPAFYQMRPIVRNARTMFKVFNELKTPSSGAENSARTIAARTNAANANNTMNSNTYNPLQSVPTVSRNSLFNTNSTTSNNNYVAPSSANSINAPTFFQ